MLPGWLQLRGVPPAFRFVSLVATQVDSRSQVGESIALPIGLRWLQVTITPPRIAQSHACLAARLRYVAPCGATWRAVPAPTCPRKPLLLAPLCRLQLATKSCVPVKHLAAGGIGSQVQVGESIALPVGLRWLQAAITPHRVRAPPAFIAENNLSRLVVACGLGSL